MPALLIIFIRGKYLTESPIWLANQGDLKGAAKVLQESYAINAVATVEKVERTAEKKKREGFAVLFNKTYLPRTIVAIVIHISVAFQYTTIAFFYLLF